MPTKLALFVHQPKCSIQSVNAIMHALRGLYEFKIFTMHAVADDFFMDVDCIVVPGGLGDASSYDRLMRHHADSIRNFVLQGGAYLGICMGAYWAGKHYLNILDSVDAVQYITRPGTDTRRPHAKACAVAWQGQAMRMYFYDGCAFVGNPRRFQTIATYANGDSMAIVQNRVGLVGCHPESEASWWHMHNYLKPHYHQGHHHLLLRQFVQQLLDSPQ